MSDTPQGDGWWQTSDGKWHPPDYDPTAPEPTAPENPVPETTVPETTVPETSSPGPSLPGSPGAAGGHAGSEPPIAPPPWSPSGGGRAPGQEGPFGAQQPPAPSDPQAGRPPSAPPFSSPGSAGADPQGGGALRPEEPLFGGLTPSNDPATAGHDDTGPFTTNRPGEFGLPSDEPVRPEPRTVRSSEAPGPAGATIVSGGGAISPILKLGGVFLVVIVVLIAGWWFLLRDNGSDEDATTATEAAGPGIADETKVPEPGGTESTPTTPETTAPLPPKPTIAPGARLPVLEFDGTGSSTVALDPPGPRVAAIDYDGTGEFRVTGLDANGGEVATWVDTQGPYKGSVAVDFRDEQDSRSLAIEAKDDWSIRMVPVESLEPLPGGFTGNGDNVVLYTGGVGPVKLTHSGRGAFEVNYFEIRSRDIETIADTTGQFEGTAELRGPAFVWVKADGQWSITPE